MVKYAREYGEFTKLKKGISVFYTAINIVHLLSACVVIGYLVYDIAIFSFFKKKRSAEEFTKLKREILKPSAIVLGCSFLTLLISGAILGSFHLGGGSGYFVSFFQKILWIKIAVILSLFVFAGISFFYMFALKKPDPLRKCYHHIALFICLIALVLAKLLYL